MRKAPRRGLRLAKFQFLLFLLVCFLLPDVIADDLFRHTDGADAVPACPKVVAREVALPPQILPMNADRRLPFQEPHRVRHTHLRWNTQQDMHVIRQRVPFHQLHAVPLTQLPNDSPNPTSHLAEDRAFPILRHPPVSWSDPDRQGDHAHSQVDAKLVDRPQRYCARVRREPAILGTRNGCQLQLDNTPQRISYS